MVHEWAEKLRFRGPLLYPNSEIRIAAGWLSEDLRAEEPKNQNRTHIAASVTGLTPGGARETILFVR